MAENIKQNRYVLIGLQTFKVSITFVVAIAAIERAFSTMDV